MGSQRSSGVPSYTQAHYLLEADQHSLVFEAFSFDPIHDLKADLIADERFQMGCSENQTAVNSITNRLPQCHHRSRLTRFAYQRLRTTLGHC